ncbi:MAG: hypothetical protein RR657_01540 [Peptostreptococcaceae bacterium]
MLKQAIEYIVGLGKRETVEVNGLQYTTDRLSIIEQPIAEAIEVTTLRGLIDYIKSNADKKMSDKLIIHINSPNQVVLRSELNNERTRENYVICNALLPRIEFDRFLGTDKFNILLQSAFVKNSDRDILLKVAGNVQESAVKQVGDDGVTQAVTMKTGVATLQDVIVPNPVSLAPFRTFNEIEQPESNFVFRMEEGPKCAIFEADGGAWRNEAMLKIKEFLNKELEEVSNIEIIS